MQIIGRMTVIGTLDDKGSQIGIVVEAADAQQITIKGMTEDQARKLAPNFMGSITINFAQNTDPVAWAAFADNGNIRVWTSAPDDVRKLAASVGMELVPLYTAQVETPARDAEITSLIAQIRAARTMAMRDSLFEQIIEVWEAPIAPVEPVNN